MTNDMKSIAIRLGGSTSWITSGIPYSTHDHKVMSTPEYVEAKRKLEGETEDTHHAQQRMSARRRELELLSCTPVDVR